jgi:hypothetical protein
LTEVFREERRSRSEEKEEERGKRGKRRLESLSFSRTAQRRYVPHVPSVAQRCTGYKKENERTNGREKSVFKDDGEGALLLWWWWLRGTEDDKCTRTTGKSYMNREYETRKNTERRGGD